MKHNIDIVFIDPPVYFNGAVQKNDGHLPNLGLCNLAAVTEREGYAVKIIDAVAHHYSNKEVLDLIEKQNPKYIGISSMTHNINSSAILAKLIKKKRPEIIIILGGVHATAATEETLKKYPDCFDCCVIGEGELTILELLDTLESHGDLSEVTGLAFLQEGKFIRTKNREPIKDLDSLPLPAWHLLPDLRKYYGSTFISSGDYSSNHLVTSRGCPGKCIFCDTSIHGRRLRGYSSDYVMEMIEILHKKYGINDIQFNDDTFITLKKRMYDICEKLVEKGYNLTWSCDARASDVTKEGLSLMKAAGCWQIAYGVETGSERIMKFLKKGINFSDIYNAFEWTKKEGISTKGFFILGHPTETHKSIQETVDLILALNIDVVGVTFFTVYPGSPIYPEIHKYGHFNPVWENAKTYEVGNFIPDGFTPQELINIRKNTLRRFYLRPNYIVKQITRIKKPYDIYKLTFGGCKAISKYVLGI